MNSKAHHIGRKRGVPNKLTSTVKESFLAAFDKIGGAIALAEWAMENKTEFYKLASKLIPADVNLTDVTPEARVYPMGPIIEHNRLPAPSEAMDSVH